MKIYAIRNSQYIYNSNGKINKYLCLNNNFNTASNKVNKLFYYSDNISFSSNKPKSISKLKSLGYETAEITNGKISNKGNNIIICSAKDLIALSQTENAWRKNFVLGNDIDLNNQNFQGIGNLKHYYQGEFDGNNHTIKNFTIQSSDSSSVGFFRSCDNAKVKNLFISNATVEGKFDVGGIAGTVENDTIFDNVEFSGKVIGLNSVGGLIGYMEQATISDSSFSGTVQIIDEQNNSDDDFFNQTVVKSNISSIAGGICGLSTNSKLYSTSMTGEINNGHMAGGLIGQSKWDEINNCTFDGTINAQERVGSIIAVANNTTLSNSCSVTPYPLVNQNTESKIINCISKISDLTKGIQGNWDKSVWIITKNNLPRLKRKIDTANKLKIFLNDINNAIANNDISVGLNYTSPTEISVQLDDLEPPKHYKENEKVLSEIKNCTNPKKLAKFFAYWTDSFRDGFNVEDKKHDEILLEIVKNKNFNLNERWNENFLREQFMFEASTWCTPLYTLSCLNKGYIFNEALKRTDIDPFVMSGPQNETDMFLALYSAPISTNMFLLFNSNNPKIKEYLNDRLSKIPNYPSSDKFTDLLCRSVLNNYQYDENNHTVTIPIKLISELSNVGNINIDGKTKYNSLLEVINSPDIPITYTDSLGNNVLHIIFERKYPLMEQILYFENSMNNGADINRKNDKGYTPFMLAINQQNDVLCERMLKHDPKDKFYCNADGDNALLLSVKYNNTKQSIPVIDKIHKKGFSLNITNNTDSTSLIEAVKNNDINKVQYCIANGAAVDLCDENGQTALHHAFMQQNTQIIKFLMNSFACLELKDKAGLRPEDYWKNCREDENFKKLNWDSTLFIYNLAGINNVVSLPLNQNDIKAIYTELLNEDYSSSSLALQNNMYYTEKQLIKLYYFLCKNIDNLNINKTELNKIFTKLVQTNNPYAKECIVKILKDYSIDINKTNQDGDTFLSLALKSYQTATTGKEKLSCMQNIKSLLDFGAKIDIPDSNGQTALHHAVYTDNVIIFNELLGKNPNVNYPDNLGKNPIQYLSKDPENPMRKAYKLYAEKRELNK